MQRLKGLLTGSLPTFFEAGQNFAAPELTEDNIILQSARQNKSMCFLGDDTWMKLFPDAFSKSFPFPSFDVTDLHTVDRGIRHHLGSVIGHYDLVIAHFLGVDHVGHRFGPSHPFMSEKLAELNEIIEETVSRMDDDTALILVGDHGMTSSGDHGGETNLEISSAFFVLAPPSWGFYTAQASSDFEQIDFAVTFSALMDVAAPFGSLGALKRDALLAPLDLDADNNMAASLYAPHETAVTLEEDSKEIEDKYRGEGYVHRCMRTNLLQVHKYVLSMQNEVSLKDMTKLEAAFSRVIESYPLGPYSRSYDEEKKFLETFDSYIGAVKYLFRASWASFDHGKMWTGLLLCFLSPLLSLLFIIRSLLQPGVFTKPSFGLFLLLSTLSSASVLSNSFIIYEDKATLFLSSTFLLILFAISPCLQSPVLPPSPRLPHSMPHPPSGKPPLAKRRGYLRAVLLIGSICIVRLFGIFGKQREEQLLTSFVSLNFWGYFWTPFGLMLLIVIAHWLSSLPASSKSRNFSILAYCKLSFGTLSRRHLVSLEGAAGTAALLLVLVVWSLDEVESRNARHWWGMGLVLYRGFVERACLFCGIIGFGSVLFRLYTRRQNISHDEIPGMMGSVLQHFCILAFLLVDALFSPVIALFALASILLSYAFFPHPLFRLFARSSSYWLLIGFAYFFCLLAFYATGHQATFSSLQWRAGLRGAWSLNLSLLSWLSSSFLGAEWGVSLMYVLEGLGIVWSGLLVVVGTFWAHAAFGIIVYFSSFQFASVLRPHLCLSVLLITGGARVCFSMLACALHCHHLMMWAVFAPRLLFDLGGFLVACIFNFLLLALA